MDYHICKLSFTAPCRFGPSMAGAGLEQSDVTCQADTLFSALANECVSFYGEEKLAALEQMTQSGELLLSDMLPYNKSSLFLPKPLWPAKNTTDKISLTEIRNRMSGAKKLKKMQYLPASKVADYMECANTGTPYTENETALADEDVKNTYQKQLLERVNCRGEENLPYFVEQVTFAENCGLYFIIGTKTNEAFNLLSSLLELLSYSGIGGKRSSGYGKFTYEIVDMKRYEQEQKDIGELYKLLTTDPKGIYMSISVLVPQRKEISLLQEGFYRLIPRSGFVTDRGYGDMPLKRNRYFAVVRGSCFKKSLEGSVIDTANGGRHAVYRYGKGLYVRLAI